MKKLITFGALVAVLAMLFAAPMALAQEDNLIATNEVAQTSGESGLLISPVINEINLEPGTNYEGTVRVTNISDKKVNVSVTSKDFYAKDETGEPGYYDDAETSLWGLAAWISTISPFELAVNETKEITYVIITPENATPGGHYAAILFSPSFEEEGQVSTQGMIGPLILANVSGDVSISGSVFEFKTDKGMYSYDPVDFLTRVQNAGNTHFKPTGTIAIKNMFGTEIDSLAINETMNNVLPDQIRAYENQWDTKGRFGWYKAELSLNYGGSVPLTATTTFFVIPWKETTIGLVVLILVIWLIVAATKKKQPANQ